MRRDILVVDDDTDILHSVNDIFEHQGHEVFTVKNGFECIHEIEKGFNGIHHTSRHNDARNGRMGYNQRNCKKRT